MRWTRLLKLGTLGMLFSLSGCGFFRERLCCERAPRERTGFFGGRLFGSADTAHPDCGCQGTLTSISGPVVSGPIITAPGETIQPTQPMIPQIKENPGRQGEYNPGMSRTKGTETKGTKDGF